MIKLLRSSWKVKLSLIKLSWSIKMTLHQHLKVWASRLTQDKELLWSEEQELASPPSSNYSRDSETTAMVESWSMVRTSCPWPRSNWEIAWTSSCKTHTSMKMTPLGITSSALTRVTLRKVRIANFLRILTCRMHLLLPVWIPSSSMTAPLCSLEVKFNSWHLLRQFWTRTIAAFFFWTNPPLTLIASRKHVFSRVFSRQQSRRDRLCSWWLIDLTQLLRTAIRSWFLSKVSWTSLTIHSTCSWTRPMTKRSRKLTPSSPTKFAHWLLTNRRKS